MTVMFARRLAAGLIGTVGVVFLLLAAVWEISGSAVDHTVANSREIGSSLSAAASFVEDFQQTTGRLPSQTEFASWASSQPDRVHDFMRCETTAFPEGVVKEFGPAPPGSFLLTYWRGEWNEYYASWTGRNTLVFDSSKYYMLGSRIADAVAFILAAGVSAWFARKLWARPTSAWSRPA